MKITMKTSIILTTVLLGILYFSSCNTSEFKTNKELEDGKDSISYVLGVNMAQSLDMNSIHSIDYDLFIKGMSDVYEHTELKIAQDSIILYINSYFKKLREERSEINLAAGNAFMKKNKNKKGVVTTQSGLQYKIIKEGTGRTPELKDIAKCKYKATTIDGEVFRSSGEEGEFEELKINRLVSGWAEGLQLMKEGGKYIFYIPPDLAYGQNVPRGGVIEPNMALIVEIELDEVIIVGIPNRKK
jgi:FKBP-type peptidyl-prolyl cis-trans isomerase